MVPRDWSLQMFLQVTDGRVGKFKALDMGQGGSYVGQSRPLLGPSPLVEGLGQLMPLGQLFSMHSEEWS